MAVHTASFTGLSEVKMKALWSKGVTKVSWDHIAGVALVPDWLTAAGARNRGCGFSRETCMGIGRQSGS